MFPGSCFRRSHRLREPADRRNRATRPCTRFVPAGGVKFVTVGVSAPGKRRLHGRTRRAGRSRWGMLAPGNCGGSYIRKSADRRRSPRAVHRRCCPASWHRTCRSRCASTSPLPICHAIPIRGAKLLLSMLMVEVYNVVNGVAVLGFGGCGTNWMSYRTPSVASDSDAPSRCLPRNRPRSFSQKSSLPTCVIGIGDLRECGPMLARQAVARLIPATSAIQLLNAVCAAPL